MRRAYIAGFAAAALAGIGTVRITDEQAEVMIRPRNTGLMPPPTPLQGHSAAINRHTGKPHENRRAIRRHLKKMALKENT